MSAAACTPLPPFNLQQGQTEKPDQRVPKTALTLANRRGHSLGWVVMQFDPVRLLTLSVTAVNLDRACPTVCAASDSLASMHQG